MLKETNLDGVKSVARMLLITPVHKTPYSPAVVQHPFASSGLVGITREGILYVLDITDSEENLKQWHEFIKSKIDEAENVWEIYAFINKPYAMTFLKFAEPYLSKEDFSKILGDAWVRSENPNDDPNFTKRDLIAMFKRADKQALMTEEDYKRWKDLEKSITVYRGVTLHNEKNKSAPTYTLKAGGSTISSGSYTNKQVVYTATDANLSYMGKIILRLDRMMVERKISLNELAERVGISNVNLSKIKNNNVTAIRFSTLAAICEVLNCEAGDILEYQKEE